MKQPTSIKHFDAIILGGGASGLMCAAQLGQQGKQVLVLEKANKLGKKILMSGGGKCNFTNYEVTASHYICNNPHFCKSALKQYTQWDFFSLVNEYGIDWEERKHGQLFCLNSAKDILDMLISECDKAYTQGGHIQFQTKCETQEIEHDKELGLYTLITNKQAYQTSKLVIASGGLSIPTLGGSGIAYDLAKQFKLDLIDRRAGLVPFTFTDKFKPLCEALSGLALEVEVSLPQNTQAPSFQENMLFTHRGLSGPVMLQASNYWHGGDEIAINLIPNEDIYSWLLNTKENHPKQKLKNILEQKLSKSLVDQLGQLYFTDIAQKPITDIKNTDLESLAKILSNWRLKPADTEGYRTAEVTLGGINTDEISSKTFECKKHPGLFFIGEALDVSGHLGGYNFQWAWSSAFACAKQMRFD